MTGFGKKENNWRLIETESGKYGLVYEPGALGEKGALIRISKEVFLEAKKGEVGLKDLFKKYELNKCEVLYEINEPIVLEPRENTPTKFYGKGFITTQKEGRYFLEYQLAYHGGGSRKFEISKEIYQDARAGNYSTSDLFKKYDLYHLDIPENDVK